MRFISLKSNNGRYVTVLPDGRLFADEPVANKASVFEIYDISSAGVGLRSGSAIALKSSEGRFVAAEGGGGRELIANRDQRDLWERFTLYDVDRQGIRSGGKIALRCAGGQFASAEDGGGREVVANRADLGTWETFTVESRDSAPSGPSIAEDRPLLADGVFEGGGALGVAYVGALIAAESHGVWFGRAAGTSAGAITACMIAAGFTSQEMEYMSAPAGLRPRPTSLPAGLEPITGLALQDLPRNASEIPVAVKRNNLLYHLLRGSLTDEVIKAAFKAAPDPTPFVDTIMSLVPGSVQFPEFKHKVPEKKIEVANPAFRFGAVEIPAGHIRFEHTIPGYEVDIPGGSISIANLKTEVRKAVTAGLKDAMTAAQKATTALTTPALRTAFADGVMDRLLNQHEFLRAFYNLLGNFGPFRGEVILNNLRSTLSKKLGGDRIRFRDLPLPLAVLACDMTNQRLIVYSTDGTPDMEVAEAVRRSLSVPLYFQARVEEGNDFVDGGMLENYPVWLFTTEGTENPYMKNTASDRQRVKLLFSLDSSQDIPANSPCSARSTNEDDFALMRMADSFSTNLIERKFIKRLGDLLDLQMQGSAIGDAMFAGYAKDFKMHGIKIPLKGFDWLDFDMDSAEFRGMCCRGWEASTDVIRTQQLRPRLLRRQTNPYR